MKVKWKLISQRKIEERPVQRDSVGRKNWEPVWWRVEKEGWWK